MTSRVGLGGDRGVAAMLLMASIVALAIAWWAEHVAGMVPCALCLVERWPWRVIGLTALLVLVLPWRRGGKVLLALIALTLLVSCALAVLHGGVEWGWWSSPLPECQAPRLTGATMAERLASMPVRPAKPCDAPAYLVSWLPVSMSVLGGLYAAALLLAMFTVAVRARGHARTGT
ncbi:disulfide bond formation protein B [Ameyamaea chiangmaiensis]|nr:disulfide bond formation protein B [Ameyamaea chiangmaiensis]